MNTQLMDARFLTDNTKIGFLLVSIFNSSLYIFRVACLAMQNQPHLESRKVSRSNKERGWQGIEKIEADFQKPRKVVTSDRTIQIQMRFYVLIGGKAIYAIRKFQKQFKEKQQRAANVSRCLCLLKTQANPNYHRPTKPTKTKSPARFPNR